MTRITLDARDWRTREDFYAAFLPAVGAPDWHGPSLDAIYDGLVAKLYRIVPPFVIEITGTRELPADMLAYLARVRTVFDDARRDYGVAASIAFAEDR